MRNPNDMIIKQEVAYGDIVQVNPDKNPVFGGCFIFVEEVKPWGVTGYVRVPKSQKACNAYLRLTWEEFEWCGQAVYHHEIAEDVDDGDVSRD